MGMMRAQQIDKRLFDVYQLGMMSASAAVCVLLCVCLHECGLIDDLHDGRFSNVLVLVFVYRRFTLVEHFTMFLSR